jgi:hypothetical protein
MCPVTTFWRSSDRLFAPFMMISLARFKSGRRWVQTVMPRNNKAVVQPESRSLLKATTGKNSELTGSVPPQITSLQSRFPTILRRDNQFDIYSSIRYFPVVLQYQATHLISYAPPGEIFVLGLSMNQGTDWESSVPYRDSNLMRRSINRERSPEVTVARPQQTAQC